MFGKYFSFYNEKYKLIKYKRCKSIYNVFGYRDAWEIIIMIVFLFWKIRDEWNNAKFEKKLTVYSL